MQLVVDIHNKLPVISSANPAPRTIPPLFVCETIAIKLFLVRPSVGGKAHLVPAESSDWQPVVAIGIPGGVVLGSCTDWEYDSKERCYEGSLCLDTPEARNAMRSRTELPVALEVQYIVPLEGMFMACQSNATLAAVVYPPGTQPTVPIANGGILIPDLDAGGYKLLRWKDGTLDVKDLPA